MTIRNADKIWQGFRRAGLVGLALALFGCSEQSEKRDFIGPPDTKPVDQAISAVVVTPGIGTVQLGESISFAAFGRKAGGDSVGVDVNWSATGGEVNGTGRFTASTPGSYRVVARSNAQADKADSATVYVVGPDNPITGVVIAPKQLDLRIGHAHQFTAKAKLQSGEEAPVAIYWSASGGVVSEEGEYIATESGTHQIIAIATNGVSDTALVTVSHNPTLVDVKLEPAETEVPTGAEEQFTVKARWSDSTTTEPKVDFSSEGGTIDGDGRFTAMADSGRFEVRATLPGAASPAIAFVRIKQPVIAGVKILPEVVRLSRGSWSLFLATARYSNNQVRLIRPTWTATGGTINSNGIYRAGETAGEFLVIAKYSSKIADTAKVYIDAPGATLTDLFLNPGSATLPAGKTQSFSVTGKWSDGGASAPAVTYTATGGTISEAGVYTAGKTAGTFRVIATQEGGKVADTSAVTILKSTVASVTINPANIAVTAGKTAQFSVSGTWTDGSTDTPSVKWAATGGAISTSGVFTAGNTAGTFRVIATAEGGTADTALVTVANPPSVLEGVVVSPAKITLQGGEAQQFVVSGVWSGGASGAGAPAVVWTATGGTVTSSGRYSAGKTAGTYRVIATQQGGKLADTAIVTIGAPAPVLTGIELTPGDATVQAGSTQQFEATGVWTNGGSGTPAVTYSATGGSISASGLYSAGGTAGTYRVIVTQQGGKLADTSTVKVTAAPPQLVGIKLTPAGVTVASGATRQYGVEGIWTNGGSGAPSVTYSATGGTISTSGLFKAGDDAGTFRVIAKQQNGSLADTVAVTVAVTAPTLTGLTVSPASVSLQTGVKRQFAVSGTWSNGSKTAPSVDWTATGGSITSAGLYTAPSTSGTYRVVAKHQGGTRADTAVVTVTAPVVTKITVTPGNASLDAGEKQQFQTTATWSDGVTRPAAVSFSATGGNVTSGGLYTAPASSGSFRVVAKVNGGAIADTAAVAVAAAAPPPPPSGGNNMFFNSAEAGCGNDSNVLMCDDFEDGDWYTKNADQANSSGGLTQTDGWAGTIYGPITPAACGGQGYRSNCAASHGRTNGSAGNGTMADHSLSSPSSDVYARFYTKPLDGYLFGAEKILSVNKGPAGVGGIYFGNLHINCGTGSAGTTGKLAWQPVAPEDGCRQILSMSAGRWYFIELHINTAAGVLQVWADDCGADGSACSGTPTLRVNLSGYRIPSGSVGSLWWENWANPGSNGTRLIDQIKVSRVGPIGFMK